MGILLGPRPLAAFEEHAEPWVNLWRPGADGEAPGGGALVGVSWVKLSTCSKAEEWDGGFLSMASVQNDACFFNQLYL